MAVALKIELDGEEQSTCGGYETGLIIVIIIAVA